MSIGSLKRIKDLLDNNFGDIGIKMYEKSIADLNIQEKPSSAEIKRLISDIKSKLIKFYGEAKTREFFGELNREITEEEKSVKAELSDMLNRIFTTKGIPGEPDFHELTAYIISRGYMDEKSKLDETLKQLTKDKIRAALNDSLIRNQIRTFLDRYQSYTQNDVEDLINYMKVKKLEIDETALKEIIEKERLFRKFNAMTTEESPLERLSKDYIGLFNSKEKRDYEYILHDEELVQLSRKLEPAVREMPEQLKTIEKKI